MLTQKNQHYVNANPNFFLYRQTNGGVMFGIEVINNRFYWTRVFNGSVISIKPLKRGLIK